MSPTFIKANLKARSPRLRTSGSNQPRSSDLNPNSPLSPDLLAPDPTNDQPKCFNQPLLMALKHSALVVRWGEDERRARPYRERGPFDGGMRRSRGNGPRWHTVRERDHVARHAEGTRRDRGRNRWQGIRLGLRRRTYLPTAAGRQPGDHRRDRKEWRGR